MKIGFVTSSFPRFERDCAGIFVLDMALALAARGHEIEVVAPQSAEPTQWEQRPAWLGNLVVHEAPYARPRSWQRLFYSPGAPEQLERSPAMGLLAVPATLGLHAAARRLSSRWDAVVSHWLVPSGLAAGLAAQRGIPHLAVAHSGDVHLLGRIPGGKSMAMQVVASSAAVGCVSAALRQELLDLLPQSARSQCEAKLHVLPMGYDPALDEVARARQRQASAKATVLCLGRLVPIKGLDVLIEALCGIQNSRILIGGDGPQREQLEDKARRRGVEATFLGAIAPSARVELFANIDIFALPSRVLASNRHEGLPLSLVEAMASGAAVVATDTGGVPEIVKHTKTGLLVPPGNPDALGAALQRLIDSPSLRGKLGEAASAAVRHRSWAALAPSYEGLLCA